MVNPLLLCLWRYYITGIGFHEVATRDGRQMHSISGPVDQEIHFSSPDALANGQDGAPSYLVSSPIHPQL